MAQLTAGKLIAQDLALEAAHLLRPLLEAMQSHDRALAEQLRRAASSVALNLAEAAYNSRENRRSRLESARGSANEARCALQLASTWGYVAEAEASKVDALYDRVLALTHRLWSG
jgi:four helix bundle protein